MKKVSAIVTTYNSEDSIDRTLQSILKQEGIGNQFDVELIVVDDCSLDNTVELAKNAGATIYSTRTNSGGPNAGRNIGLKNATGDYICIVDHDDEWKPERIKNLLPHLENAPIVSSGYTRIDATSGKKTDFLNHRAEDVIAFRRNETFLSKLTRTKKGQGTYIGSLIYRKELAGILFEEHYGCVDYDWVLRLFRNHESIEVNRSLYFRHVEGDNLSLNLSYREKDYEFSLQFVESLKNEYPKEVVLSKKRINGTRARYHYVMGEMAKARHFFRQSEFSLKTVAYYLTTFAGHKFVNRKFNVFK